MIAKGPLTSRSSLKITTQQTQFSLKLRQLTSQPNQGVGQGGL
jgi:hypothetical protein